MNVLGAGSSGAPIRAAAAASETPASATDFLELILGGHLDAGLANPDSGLADPRERLDLVPRIPSSSANDTTAHQLPVADQLYLCGWLASGHLCYVTHAISGAETAERGGSSAREMQTTAGSLMPFDDGGNLPAATFPNNTGHGPIPGPASMRVEAEASMATTAACSGDLPGPRMQWLRRRITIQKGKQSVSIYLRDYSASEQLLRQSAEQTLQSLRLPRDHAVSVTANGRSLRIAREEAQGRGENGNGCG